MTARSDVRLTRRWMAEGTEQLARAVAELPDAALRRPSGLPGWSRAHVLAHLARNAEALSHLAHWAATGEETPMYPDLGARAADIERTSANAPAQLRSDLAQTAGVLEAQLGAFSDAAWAARVRSALGREISAAEIPWMRVREVWLHALDLDAGVQVGEFPPDLVDALLDDITPALSRKPECPAAALAATDRHRTWTFGPAAESSTRTSTEVHGSAAALLAWVAGRSPGADLTGPTPLPTLPPWI